MKKLLYSFVFFILCLISTGYSQYVEIGTGTVNNGMPFYSSWNYTWSDVIYTQIDLGGAKTITKIAFNNTGVEKTMTNQMIYMKHSSNAIFGSAAYEDPTNNGYTLVYSGDITFATGWTSITLQTSFEYNGTDNLIIHEENRWGQSYGPTLASTTSAINNNKNCGNDVSFPSGASGNLNPYPSSLPNVRFYYSSTMPATPDNAVPADKATKIDLNAQLSFMLGANTTSYDLYFSQDSLSVVTLNASVKVVADATVSAAGTFTYTPSQILNANTKYFWIVVAKDGANVTNGNLWRFTTQNVISSLPYIQGFEGVDIFFPGWYGFYTDWTYPTTGSDAIWGKSGELNAHSDTCALSGSPYSGSEINSSIMTPRFSFSAGTRYSFYWRNGNYNVKTSNNDTTFFEITTNGGSTWTGLDTLSPASAQSDYVFVQKDISAYAGNNVYFRWRYVRHNTSNSLPVFIDDFKVETIPNGAVIDLSSTSVQFTEIAVNAHNTKKVEIYNLGTQDLNITSINVSLPFSASSDITTIVPGDTAILSIILNGTQVGTPTATLTISSNATGNSEISLNGSVIGLTGSFYQTFDAVPENQLPENWNKLRSSNPNELYNDVYVKNSPSDAHSAPNVLRILNANDSISPLVLLTEGVSNFNSNTLTFYAAKTYNVTNQVDLIVGVMDDPDNISTFDTVQTITLTDVMTQYTVTFSNTNIKPYIAFKHGQKKTWQSIWIDDIDWSGNSNVPPACASLVFPANNAVDQELSLNLKWTSNSSDVTGYKLNLGTDTPPTDIYSNKDLGNVLEFALADLPIDVTLNWQIIPYNVNGDATGCPVWSFTTMSDQTLDVPWEQGFEGLTPQAGVQKPLGWSVVNGGDQSATWDLIANNETHPDNAHSGTNAMNIAFSFMNPLNDWLITPPINLQTGYTYTFTFWLKAPIYDDGTTQSSEKLGVFIGNANDTLALVNELWNSDFIQLADYTEQTITFPIETSGKYYIGFHSYSDPLQWITMIDDVSMSGVLSVDNISDNVSIYPNPANSYININLPQDNESYNLEIANISGQIVKSNSINSKYANIDISSLMSGIYTIKFTSISGKTIVKTFIKN